jgi:hypothetical protein
MTKSSFEWPGGKTLNTSFCERALHLLIAEMTGITDSWRISPRELTVAEVKQMMSFGKQ